MNLKLFFDSDTIIAGCASLTGASFILLQLCELGLIEGITSKQNLDECRRNIIQKLPQAEIRFEQVIKQALEIVENSREELCEKYENMADIKDIPILATAIESEAKYLVTFNTKHFYPVSSLNLTVCLPGEMLQKIRKILNKITN